MIYTIVPSETTIDCFAVGECDDIKLQHFQHGYPSALAI